MLQQLRLNEEPGSGAILEKSQLQSNSQLSSNQVEHVEQAEVDVRSRDVTPDTARRIPCSICSETFAKRSNLKRHMKRKHDGDNSVDVNIEVTNSSSSKSSSKKRAKNKAPNQVELSNDKEEEKAPEQ